MEDKANVLIWGWDAVNKVWRPILVTAAGAIKVKAA